MAEEMNMQGSYHEITDPDKEQDKEGRSSLVLDPLSLSIEDDELVRIVDEWVTDYETFYNEKDLKERRQKNERYYFGRQIIEKEKEKLLKNYESRYQDNVLYEIMATIKPVALSRMPDLMITPGNDSDEAVLMAKEVGKALDAELKEEQNRRILGIASKHLPVYFTAVLKVRWDNEADDYVFEVIHPSLIEVDHTCPTNDADQMRFVSQIVPITVQELLLRFPDKKDEIIPELAKDGLAVGEDGPTWKQMATEIRMREVWFTEYVKKSNHATERVEGVLWKYHDCILNKMKNPNFDYEGEDTYVAYDATPTGATQRLPNALEQAQLALGVTPENVEKTQVYHNYFRFPRKPFYFFGYDQWNQQPYDETSWLEQNIHNQKNLDKRGKQIDETLDNKGHHVFLKSTGLTPADIESLDMANPETDLLVDGDNVNNAHSFIAPDRPTAQEFQDLANTRQRMHELAGVTAIQGEMQSQTATTNQIARENNFTTMDDVVADTINPAATWMAEWAMQLIKLRYTAKHWRWILGAAGEAVSIQLSQNMISDGMLVKIKASGTDKLRAQNNAMDMAKMQMIDPFNFYRDMGLSDPEGRTEYLLLFKTDPMGYMAKAVKGLDTPEKQAQALMAQPLPNQPMQPPQPMAPQMAPQGPQMPGAAPMAPQGAPAQPTAQNTAAVPISPPAGPPQGSPRLL